MKYVLIILASVVSLQLLAQEGARIKNNNLEDDLAIKGYDPIAYFTQKKAIKGTESYKYVHEGIPYWFSSQINLDTFKSSPDKYEPAYGGWCAYAMGTTAEKVVIDPETFKIVDGKLYLFYNFFFNNTLKDWNKDEVNLKQKADANWSEIIR